MEPRLPPPALLVVGALSRHADARAWGRRRFEEAFGPVELAGPVLPFDQTGYYEPTMGAGLEQQLLVFATPVAPDRLAEIKHFSDGLEREYAGLRIHPEGRPVNLDPGLLDEAKLVLATTKDQAHRVYLRDGVFAEVTLRYRDGAFEPWPWTYPSYRRDDVRAFLTRVRAFLRRLRRREHG
jgi:hypothetical protein